MRRIPDAVLVPILVLGLALAALPALAQTDEPPPGDDGGDAEDASLQEALRLSELGRLHYDGGEFAEAATAFSRAFALQPDPVLGYNAARSYENAGDPERALEMYQAVLALEPADAALAQRCRDGVTRIENLLARVEQERQSQPATLEVEADPVGALVTVDGEAAGEAPLELSLPAGDYAVEVASPGHLTYSETVSLRPGQALALRVNLPELPPEPEEEGGPTWWAVGLSGGLGVACLLVGAAAAIGAQQRYDEAQTPEVLRDEARFNDVVAEGQSLKGSSTFFYALGIAGVATAVLLYFVTDDSPDDTDESAFGVTPGPGDLGAGLGWRF